MLIGVCASVIQAQLVAESAHEKVAARPRRAPAARQGGPGLGLEEAAVHFHITYQNIVLKMVNPFHPKRDAWEMWFSREYLGLVI